MTLSASESGTLTYIKRAGAVFDCGSVIAKLALDDPSRAKDLLVFSEPFPPNVDVPQQVDKLNHVVQKCRAAVDQALAGYASPEPYFGRATQETIETLMRSLRLFTYS